LAANISQAAIFRYVENKRPTLIIDEGDTFLASNEEMRGILNSGHTRQTAYVIRCVEVGGDITAQRFSTWAPKVIASIGSLPGTLEDQAIIVRMHRKPKAAKVERFRRRDCAEYGDLRRQAMRWATDHLEDLRSTEPKLPAELNDRAADNWEPLLAIADLAGEVWARKARDAALVLSGEKATGEDELGVELLHDIRAAFDTLNNPDAIFEEATRGARARQDDANHAGRYGRCGCE
jgi:putative DNA primase/helicase